MATPITKPLDRLRPGSARRRGDQLVDRPAVAPSLSSCAPEARARDAGGPVDNASYTCCCGLVFSASVSASVSCPVCGIDQDW
jgi:hypothetical protein